MREVDEFFSDDVRVWTEGEDVLIADLCVCKKNIKSGGDERDGFFLLKRDLIPIKPVAKKMIRVNKSEKTNERGEKEKEL